MPRGSMGEVRLNESPRRGWGPAGCSENFTRDYSDGFQEVCKLPVPTVSLRGAIHGTVITWVGYHILGGWSILRELIIYHFS